MSHQEALGAVLKGLRRTFLVAQDELSSISVSYVQRMERGIANPTLDVLEDLAKVLSIDVFTLTALISAQDKGENIYDLLTRALSEIRMLDEAGALRNIADAAQTETRDGRPLDDHKGDNVRRAHELRAQGLSFAEIGAEMGISKTSAIRYLRMEVPDPQS